MDSFLKQHLIDIVRSFHVDQNGALHSGDSVLPMDSQAYANDPNSAVRQCIMNALYLSAHCQRFGAHRFDIDAQQAENQDISPLLSQSNACDSRWDEGWRIEQALADGTWSARRGAETSVLRPGEFVLEDPYGPGLSVGSSVRVLRSHESTTLQPGIYFAFGTAQSAAITPGDQLIRLYWNVRPEGASRLVNLVTSTFQRFQLPFRFKIMSQTRFFYRIDTAVLYVSSADFRITASLAGQVHRSMEKLLRPDTCLFTKPIAPGISLAEDPNDGQSFGQARCGVLADATLHCLRHETTSDDDIWQIIQSTFSNAGIDLETPYLNAGNNDRYDLDHFNLKEAA